MGGEIQSVHNAVLIRSLFFMAEGDDQLRPCLVPESGYSRIMKPHISCSRWGQYATAVVRGLVKNS